VKRQLGKLLRKVGRKDIYVVRPAEVQDIEDKLHFRRLRRIEQFCRAAKIIAPGVLLDERPTDGSPYGFHSESLNPLKIP
jgi:hypothetical protein